MKSTIAIRAIVLAAATVLAGCANTSPQQTTSIPYSTPYQNTFYGSVESIQVIRNTSNGNTSGAGAVVGGLVGGLLGNQVGGGNGRTAATVVGAVGGAMVGNNVEQNRGAQGPDMYQIRVRLDNGDNLNVTQDSIYDLRVGNRVRVADGRAYRY